MHLIIVAHISIKYAPPPPPPAREGSLPVHILDRFLRKQNLKFAVTMTEVVLLRRRHELIKLNWMRDLPGQKAVTEVYPTRPLSE